MKAFVPTINGGLVPLTCETFDSADAAAKAAQKVIDDNISEQKRLLHLEPCGIASGISKTLDLWMAAKATSAEVDRLQPPSAMLSPETEYFVRHREKNLVTGEVSDWSDGKKISAGH